MNFSEFQVYFQVGYQHIVAWDGLDHILFIVALCAMYSFSQWKTVFWLATAFTLGHSLTLALAALGWLTFNKQWIEFFIPITILCTALLNLLEANKPQTTPYLRYAMATIFGFIHGFAFSQLLRSMFQQSGQSLVYKLLAFNIGIEVGQILVIGFVLAICFIFVRLLQWQQQRWSFVLSVLTLILAGFILFQKSTELFA
ncbi:MAG TPA: HupE / UreJ protein [Microscillaceae bacterium]|jgi:hypothetical protein|nr:HupE / UreJ protein [Microscillaceae bacterium]